MEPKLPLILLIFCAVLHERILAERMQYWSRSKRVVLNKENLEDKERVNIENYPWLVVVQKYVGNSDLFPYYPICGGSMLTSIFVLTAYHCLPKDQSTELSVRSGSTFKLSGGVVHRVIQTFPHPQGYDHRYDLALLKIEPSVRFNGGNNFPIQIFTGKVESGSEGLVLGWGLAQESPRLAINYLRSETVIIKDESYCRKHTGRGDFLICTFASGLGTCPGDSGGPLVVSGKLAGVISHGNGICGNKEFPNIFVNVSYHAGWIKSIIAPKFELIRYA